MNINYIKNGDYELPNLTLKNKNEKGINKYVIFYAALWL